MKTVTRCPENRDEIDLPLERFVTLSVTSLFYHTYTACRTTAEQTGGSHDPR